MCEVNIRKFKPYVPPLLVFWYPSPFVVGEVKYRAGADVPGRLFVEHNSKSAEGSLMIPSMINDVRYAIERRFCKTNSRYVSLDEALSP
jgi:hypothetical protein